MVSDYAYLPAMVPERRVYTQYPKMSATHRAILKHMLFHEEGIVEVGTISTGIYWRSIATGILAAILLLIAPLLGIFWFMATLFGVFLVGAALVMLATAYLMQHYLLLMATDSRVIVRAGILNLEVVQIRYSKIESCEVLSSPIGRFLGYETVVITGTGGFVIVIPFVTNASAFRDIVSEILVNRDKLADQAHIAQAAAA